MDKMSLTVWLTQGASQNLGFPALSPGVSMLEIGLLGLCLEALTSWSNHAGAGKMKETQVILGFQGNKRAYRSRIKQTLPTRAS